MLLALGLSGILSFDELFLGFASPATITVIAALVMAKALYNSGILDSVETYLSKFQKRPIIPMILLFAAVSIASGFINNMAALAITLPIAISLSNKLNLKASKILIPLAYASIIGGSLTLIGTPSNIVIGSIAREEFGQGLDIFEFTSVGLPLIAGFIILFLILGKKILPARSSPYDVEEFNLPKYLAEVQVTERSKYIDKTIMEIEKEFDVEVVRIVREHKEREIPRSNTKISLGDLLVIRTDPKELESVINGTGLKPIVLNKNESGEFKVSEIIVLPDSLLIDKSARQIRLRDYFDIALIGIGRRRNTITKRVDDIKIRMGDVLLIEHAKADLQTVIQDLRCAPLHTKGITLHSRSPPLITLGISAASIALSAFGILPIEIALTLGAVALVLSRSLTLKEGYTSIQWPIVILIGSLIPFGMAMQKTGADAFIATLISDTGISDPILALAILFAGTIVLSNMINNVAAAVFMAPVALKLAEIIDVSGIPMLMGVAFGAALPFLTPIGHQSSLLVMDAGGYKFSDYLRFGIPLTILCTIIVLILVPLFWGF